jgi:ABC-2 type transport system ATP-binding protein
MKYLAGQGRTVFVSSHLMNEMAVTAEHLIVIGRGRLIADCSTEEFIARSSDRSVLVKSPDAARLSELITTEGGIVKTDDGTLTVGGLPAPRIGELAASESLVLHELTPQLGSLEEAFMELTCDSVEFDTHGSQPGEAPAQAPAEEGTR